VKWGGAELGGGGFESGGESYMRTLECTVVSNPPHSQGVSIYKKKCTQSYCNLRYCS
jgi:hypothetical protein